MAIHRGNHWTPEEDQRLLELIGSGKSWVLISALLKRSQLSIKERARYLKRKSAKTKPPD
jgi:Myb-like DNA-binding domain